MFNCVPTPERGNEWMIYTCPKRKRGMANVFPSFALQASVWVSIYLLNIIIMPAANKFMLAAMRHTAVTPRTGISNVLTSRAPRAAPM